MFANAAWRMSAFIFIIILSVFLSGVEALAKEPSKGFSPRDTKLIDQIRKDDPVQLAAETKLIKRLATVLADLEKGKKYSKEQIKALLREDLTNYRNVTTAHIEKLREQTLAIEPKKDIALFSEAVLASFVDKVRLFSGSTYGTPISKKGDVICKDIFADQLLHDWAAAISGNDKVLYAQSLAEIVMSMECHTMDDARLFSVSLAVAYEATLAEFAEDEVRSELSSAYLTNASLNLFMIVQDHIKAAGPGPLYDLLGRHADEFQAYMVSQRSLVHTSGFWLYDRSRDRLVSVSPLCEAEWLLNEAGAGNTKCTSLTGLYRALLDPYQLGLGTCGLTETITTQYDPSRGYTCYLDLCLPGASSGTTGYTQQVLASGVTPFGANIEEMQSQKCGAGGGLSSGSGQSFGGFGGLSGGQTSCMTDAIMGRRTLSRFQCVSNVLAAGQVQQLTLSRPDLPCGDPTISSPLVLLPVVLFFTGVSITVGLEITGSIRDGKTPASFILAEIATGSILVTTAIDAVVEVLEDEQTEGENAANYDSFVGEHGSGIASDEDNAIFEEDAEEDSADNGQSNQSGTQFCTEEFGNCGACGPQAATMRAAAKCLSGDLPGPAPVSYNEPPGPSSSFPLPLDDEDGSGFEEFNACFGQNSPLFSDDQSPSCSVALCPNPDAVARWDNGACQCGTSSRDVRPNIGVRTIQQLQIDCGPGRSPVIGAGGSVGCQGDLDLLMQQGF